MARFGSNWLRFGKAPRGINSAQFGKRFAKLVEVGEVPDNAVKHRAKPGQSVTLLAKHDQSRGNFGRPAHEKRRIGAIISSGKAGTRFTQQLQSTPFVGSRGCVDMGRHQSGFVDVESTISRPVDDELTMSGRVVDDSSIKRRRMVDGRCVDESSTGRRRSNVTRKSNPESPAAARWQHRRGIAPTSLVEGGEQRRLCAVTFAEHKGRRHSTELANRSGTMTHLGTVHPT